MPQYIVANDLPEVRSEKEQDKTDTKTLINNEDKRWAAKEAKWFQINDSWYYTGGY